MGFQNGAFQTPIAFQSHTGMPSGGYKKHKFDSEAYAYVYNHADLLRRRQRVDSLPEYVKEAVLDAVEMPIKADRQAALESRLGAIESQFRTMYLDLMESYYQAMLDADLARMLLKVENDRLEQENIAIMLLLL